MRRSTHGLTHGCGLRGDARRGEREAVGAAGVVHHLVDESAIDHGLATAVELHDEGVRGVDPQTRLPHALIDGQLEHESLVASQLVHHDDAEVGEDAEKLMDWFSEAAVTHKAAANAEEAEELWEVRRKGSQAMKKLANTKLNEDVVVPLKRQAELVAFVNDLREERDLRIGTFGHCGDGNLHVNFMYDREDADETERAREALDELMRKVVDLGGAISGEHGVGLAKTEFVRRMFNDAEWKTMQAIKKTLDPNGILNPGKIFEPFRPWEHVPVNETLPWENEPEECQPAS